MSRWLARAALVAGVVLFAPSGLPALSASGGLETVVKDDGGKPVADAVVTLAAPGPGAAPRSTPGVMDQQNKEFVPVVLSVTVGSPVVFPNRDNIRHHVYSFSPAKRFELPLYIGTPAAPVVFDKPGAIVLGCNIHDWMVGYVYVVTTPYFAKTAEDGRARLADVPTGTYEARVWHPRMRSEPEKTGKPISIVGGEAAQLDFVMGLRPDRRPPRRPDYQGVQGN
jgi:plastocyanin